MSNLPQINFDKPVFKLFPDQMELAKEGKCTTCGKEIKIEDYRDPLSLQEYKISGMCQECQDSVFGID